MFSVESETFITEVEPAQTTPNSYPKYSKPIAENSPSHDNHAAKTKIYDNMEAKSDGEPILTSFLTASVDSQLLTEQTAPFKTYDGLRKTSAMYNESRKTGLFVMKHSHVDKKVCLLIFRED